MIYFFSDVHLGHFRRDEDKKIEDQFIKFLKKISQDASEVYMVGDIFDYWFEYRTVIPKIFTRTLAQLAEMREKGIKIEYIMGNHDFGHVSYFKDELDIPIYREDIQREFNGVKVYLSHGDGKAYNDTGYKILKKILRNRFLLRLYMWVHPDFGIGLASKSSQKSRGYTEKKNYGRRDGMKDFAENKLVNEAYDYVLMGHSHRPEDIVFGNGHYINTGNMFHNPTFARFDGKEIKLVNLRDFLSE